MSGDENALLIQDFNKKRVGTRKDLLRTFIAGSGPES
jgi:hypothetical protein